MFFKICNSSITVILLLFLTNYSFIKTTSLNNQETNDFIITSQHYSTSENYKKLSSSIRSFNQVKQPHTEALVASLLDALTSTTFDQYYHDYVNDQLCTISTISRRPITFASTNLELTPSNISNTIQERALNCSQLDKNNYNKIFKNINRRDRLSIQQIHFSGSESSIVFLAIDLICNRLDCSNLTVLNVSGHEIHEAESLTYWLNSWTKLEVLDLSYTYLSSIEWIFQGVSTFYPLQKLTTLILDTNLVTLLDFNYILGRAPNIRHLSLINNSIYDIACQESLRPVLKNQFKTINLAGNEINCNKNHLWFIKQFLNPSINLKYPDFDKINCSSPIGLSDMTWPQRISVLETKICQDCECRSLKGVAVSVDCHNRNLTSLPENLPLNTKVLNLTNNRIDSFDLPYNSRNWENVTYVYLENNLLTSFKTLGKNSKFMKNLAALDIRKNKFQEFPSNVFEQFVNLDQVHLSNNPWLCDCKATFVFQEWLQRQFHKVNDKEEITCGISGSDENGVKSYSLHQRLSARVIYKLSKSELCPQYDTEEPIDWLDLINIILALTILLILSKVAADYVYQYRTKRLPHFFKLNY